ncbi:MAG: hypothetical protein K9J30_04580 [Bacteroidales bacterium]|nr:hypothetical protein [Bacteroidales bacterium]
MKPIVTILTLIFILASCNNFEPEKLERQPGQEGSRQIHLDFHTSEQLENIGEHFNKKQFQEALIAGNVNSINIFAKGHHSWSYYPTKIGKMHPHLDFDLMGAQIEACKEIGVSVQLYFTVGWSATDAINHPEWAVLRQDGSNDYRDMVKRLGDNEDFWGWEYLAPEGPYAELILAQTEEILENYDVDGIWYDIHQPERLNYNAFSMKDLKKHGIDPNNREAVRKRTNERYHEFFQKTHDLIKSYDEDASVYYNGTTRTYNDENISYFKYKFYQYNTKQDLEDLPTSWAGYDVFPWRSKYFAGTGKEVVAMSGKFHKSWGEFGGFKDKEAILYEAASMIAFGANCNFGDQLHPSGIMDMATYENIGHAYDYVEKIEAYGIGGTSAARTGLYVSESKAAIEGTVNMLLESQVNFNVVNLLDDWSEFEVLIVTSGGIMSRDLQKIRDYVQSGGKLIVMGKGAFLDGKPIADIGAYFIGEANYDIDYTIAGEEIIDGLVPSPFLNYNAAIRVKSEEGTEVLAKIREPYFSRTIHHYTSHRNTPYRLEDAFHPAITRNGNVIFLAHDLDKQYYSEGARLQRDIFINSLNLLRQTPYVEVDMPSMGRINLLKQAEKNRYVLHLLYASPIQRGSVRVIEDLVTLYDIPVSIHLEENIKQAYLVPSGEKIRLKKQDGKWIGNIPELTCHTGLVLEYE